MVTEEVGDEFDKEKAKNLCGIDTSLKRTSSHQGEDDGRFLLYVFGLCLGEVGGEGGGGLRTEVIPQRRCVEVEVTISFSLVSALSKSKHRTRPLASAVATASNEAIQTTAVTRTSSCCSSLRHVPPFSTFQRRTVAPAALRA